MKQINLSILVLILSLALFLTGCNGNSTTEPSASEPTTEETASSPPASVCIIQSNIPRTGEPAVRPYRHHPGVGASGSLAHIRPHPSTLPNQTYHERRLGHNKGNVSPNQNRRTDEPTRFLKPQRRSIRVPGYDYRQGLFFVTICAHQRQMLFGEVVESKMALSALGEIVADVWRKTAVIRANVSLDRFVVMPNHFHAITELNSDEVVGASRCVAQAPADKRTLSLRKDSLGAVVAQFKSAVVKRFRQRFADESYPVWQRGYYERIILNERELNAIRQYIENNVSRWAEDRDNLDLLVSRMNGR